jgi:hypothetical protein
MQQIVRFINVVTVKFKEDISILNSASFAGPLSSTTAMSTPRGGLIFNTSARTSLTDIARKPIQPCRRAVADNVCCALPVTGVAGAAAFRSESVVAKSGPG